MIHLAVWIALPEGGDAGNEARVGELVFGEPDGHGRYAGEFRYAADWLARADTFALDPESLPLRLETSIVRSENLRPPLSVFEDALPDRWGRSLLVAGHRLPLREQHEPKLLQLVGGDALGALRFRSPAAREQPSSLAPLSLAKLIDAADRFENRAPIADATLARLMAAGGSPGGARPKALVRHAGAEWIAKFPSRVLDDGMDIVRLEAASLELARRAGIEVPAFEVVPIGARHALLIKRFDVTPQGGRRHMLSFRTLCGEWPGVHVFDYGTLAMALRKHAARPAAQAAEFFRRMVFNAALGNTDDHLKNFWIVRDQRGWSLSPAFDLLPDTGRRRQHTLAFDLHPDPPARATVAVLGNRWGVACAGDIVDEVVNAVQSFVTVAQSFGVPAPDIAAFEGGIAQRCGALRGV